MKFIKTFVVVLLFFSLTAIAQTKEKNYLFKAITTEDGLSNNIVYSILKDNEGYVWIATDNGLNRYNGYSTEKYFNKLTDSTSISSSVIRSLIEDKNGNIWIGTKNGITLFHEEKKNFSKPLKSSDTLLKNKEIMKMALDSDGKIWINTLNDIGFINPETSAFQYVLNSDTNPYMAVADKKVWMLNGKGRLSFYNIDLKAVEVVVEDSALIGKPIHFGEYSKKLWLPSQIKSKLDDKTYSVLPKLPNQLAPNHLLEIDSETLLIGTIEGLFEFNFISNGLKKLHLGQSILVQQVRSIYKDNLGSVWVGTLGGVYHYDPHRKIFQHIDLDQTSDDIAMGLQTVTNGIYVNALGKGVYFKSNQSDDFKKIDLPSDFPNQGLFVWDFIEVPESNFRIWMATNEGVLCFNSIQSKYKKIDLPLLQNDQDISFSILNTNNDFVWVSSHKAIHKVAKQNGKVLKSFPLNNYMKHSGIQKIVALDKYIFIATEGEGLLSFNIKTYEVSNLYTGNKVKETFESPIWDLYVDDNILWIGTNQGLYKLVIEEMLITPILQDDQIIFSIVQDDEGVLWMGSDKGLKTYNTKSKQVRYYDTNNGLINKEFNRKSVTKTSDGTLWFGGVNGITTFEPDKIKKDNPNVPYVYVTNLEVITSDSTFSVPYNEKQITLPWDHNTIEISYVGLNYTNPSQNSYRYKMEGYDPNWVSYNEPSKARYVKLPVGSYTFNVIAANNDGLWNIKGDSVKIKIIPPIWRTNTAYVLYFLALIGLINLFNRLRKYRARIKQVEYEKLQIAKKVEETAIILNNKSKVYLDKLKYIKSDGNYLEFITDEKTIIDRNKLKDILDDLPPNFVRIHRSYVVNKNFIQALNSKTIFLNPDIEIPLSRTFKTNVSH